MTFNLLCFKIKIGSPASIHKTQCLSWERVFRSASVSTTIVSSTLRPLLRAFSQMRLHEFGDQGSAASASQLRRGRGSLSYVIIGSAARRRLLSAVDPRLPFMSRLPDRKWGPKPEPAASPLTLQWVVIGAADLIGVVLAKVCRAEVSGCRLGP